MAKRSLDVFRRTGQPLSDDVIDLEALIKSLGLATNLDEGNIRQTGVGLREGEIEALDKIGQELGDVARNALLRYGARLLIAMYRAGRLNLAGDVQTPPAPRKKLKMPGSKK